MSSSWVKKWTHSTVWGGHQDCCHQYAGTGFEKTPQKPIFAFGILCQICHNVLHRLFHTHMQAKWCQIQVIFQIADVRPPKFKLQDDCKGKKEQTYGKNHSRVGLADSYKCGKINTSIEEKSHTSYLWSVLWKKCSSILTLNSKRQKKCQVLSTDEFQEHLTLILGFGNKGYNFKVFPGWKWAKWMETWLKMLTTNSDEKLSETRVPNIMVFNAYIDFFFIMDNLY